LSLAGAELGEAAKEKRGKRKQLTTAAAKNLFGMVRKVLIMTIMSKKYIT
jgi:hypothetical protein